MEKIKRNCGNCERRYESGCPLNPELPQTELEKHVCCGHLHLFDILEEEE